MRKIMKYLAGRDEHNSDHVHIKNAQTTIALQTFCLYLKQPKTPRMCIYLVPKPPC